MKTLLSLLLFFVIQDLKVPVDLENTPVPALKCLETEADRIEISRKINPFYLRGDFDGDGKPDYVLLVQDRKSKKQGYAFCFAGANSKPYIVGAGNLIEVEGGISVDDFSSMDLWGIVQYKSKKPNRDALYLAQSESGKGLLVWNGKRMVWHQIDI